MIKDYLIFLLIICLDTGPDVCIAYDILLLMLTFQNN